MYRTDLWLPRVGVEVCRVEMDWVFGISRHKPVYIGWINNEPLLFSTWNYIQYPVIIPNGKEH